ncbi:MAG: hypothetical protein Q8N53_04400 [Longimicrobiales bacterium]|nr:hypothetical protein [Longimicrobiales bacterium]
MDDVRPPRWGSRPQKSQAGRAWALVFAGVIATVILAILAREPTPLGEEVAEPPAEAIGRWTTGDPRYAGRALVVTRTSVTLELGAHVPRDEGILRAVRTWREGGSSVVRLEYSTVDGDQTVEMILIYPGRMELRNPSGVVWTRSR